LINKEIASSFQPLFYSMACCISPQALDKSDHCWVVEYSFQVERDHRFIKQRIQPMKGFKVLRLAKATLAGIERHHRIKKVST
jgi:transposase-like protein